MIKRLNNKLINTFPKLFLNNYSRKCKKIIGGNKIFLLSFDCDNDIDIEASLKIESFLNKNNIKATWAVPGEILRIGLNEFKKISRAGNCFIGHGYRRHSEIKDNTYLSTYFYNKIDNQELEKDIKFGIEEIKKCLGVHPAGFRIPHFGHSSERTELERVYRILNEIGIKYSSSTLPGLALSHGPMFETLYEIFEIPISPGFTSPLSIIDTYNYGFRKNQAKNFSGYFLEMSKIINYYKNKPVVLNYYCDPSQAVQMASWFKVIELAADSGYEFLTLDKYYERFKRLCPKIRP